MSAKGFDTGPDGNVITMPLTGYSIAPVADSAILARLEYVESPDQLRTGGKAVQLVLTPHIALELAAILTRQAQRILGLPIPDQKQ